MIKVKCVHLRRTSRAKIYNSIVTLWLTLLLYFSFSQNYLSSYFAKILTVFALIFVFGWDRT